MFKSMKRIIRWAGKYKGRLYLGSVCSFFSSLSTAIPTMAAAFALDKVIQAYWTNTAIDTVLIWQMLGIIIGSIALNFLLSYLRAVLQESIGYEVAAGQRIHLGVGPYTEFGLSAKFKKGGTRNDLYERASQEDLPAIKDSNTGFGVMAGYEFAFGLQVNISYKVSVSNLLDANSGTARFHPQAFSLGVAYRFGR